MPAISKDDDGQRATQSCVLIARLFHLVLSSNFRLSKEMHMISPSGVAMHVNCTHTGDAGATYKTPANTGVLFVFYPALHCPFNSLPHNKMKK